MASNQKLQQIRQKIRENRERMEANNQKLQAMIEQFKETPQTVGFIALIRSLGSMLDPYPPETQHALRIVFNAIPADQQFTIMMAIPEIFNAIGTDAQ